MIIKKIRAFKFGKLNNVDLELSDSFNVIYGQNESGKSTVQAFIKACLFGAGNKRIRDIRQDERTKIIPINENTAHGELEILHSERDMIIQRSFGKTKKDDLIKVIDSVTGETQEELSFQSLGEEILKISSDTFENTLFIKQLGTIVTKSKDDEIMTKITGMFQAGGDEVSHDKSIKKLLELKKNLVAPRKGGSLDLLRIRLSNLVDERYKRLKLSEENVQDELKQINLKEHKDFLIKEIGKLELYKKYLKKTKLQKEYKDIMEYLRKSQELKSNKEKVEEDLNSDQGQINLAYLEELEESLDVVKNVDEAIESKLQEKNELEQTISQKEKNLEDLIAFYDLPQDIESKVIKVNLENENLKDKLKAISSIREEIKSIDQEINSNLNFVQGSSYLEERREDIAELLNEYEAELRYTETLLQDQRASKKQISKQFMKSVKNKKVLYSSLAVLGISVGIVILSLLPLLKILGIVIMLLGIVFGGLYININEKFKAVKKDNEDYNSYINLLTEKKQHIELYENNIGEICEAIKVNDYKQLILVLNKFDKIKFSLQLLKEKKKDKENFLTALGEDDVKKELYENEQAINKVLMKTNSEDIDEFMIKIRTYRMLMEEINSVKVRKDLLMDSIEMLQKDKESKLQILDKRLSSVKIYSKDYSVIKEQLQKFKEKIRLKNEIEISLKNTEETYKLLLKDRDISFMEMELQEFIDKDISYSYESEDEIENELNEKNKELLETEKSLKDIENDIKTLFLGSRELYLIEEDIINVKKEIQNQEENLEAIEIAMEVINEAFKDMQKNFGPILNTKVANYMSFLTCGKYTDIRVSENYNLSIGNEENNSLMVAELLSNGTWDQIYLSLRLALIDLIFGDEVVPIILDEAFVQYDDERMKRAIELLYSLRERRQIIIFTCQKREVEYTKDYSDIKVINL
ncbi:AAA family ATPase [Inconstantimicrobium mannanitabidum]|uniref:Double-stranded DNA repair protein Rad50 n=1 Tax=Inconstantimicrobium mannanitabidum TaxID=1604901 RepID=A0ACB5R7M2_9CLOT|nr:AAA family ATPase [Clostridium sp. TW13]GKX65075.1 double-stranded DNA repair protein Rad50 [Clostridium sp. TW13]